MSNTTSARLSAVSSGSYTPGIQVPEKPDNLFTAELLAEMRSYFTINVKSQPLSLSKVTKEPAVIMVQSNESGKLKFITNKFYLINLQESRAEKTQILETFGEPHISFFGEKTRIYQGQGQLLESESSSILHPYKYRWASSFAKFYDEELRGSKLVEKDNVAIIDVGNNILYGYFLSLNMVQSAGDPYKKQFSFSFIIKEHRYRINEELEALYGIAQQMDPSQRALFNDLQRELSEVNQIIEDLEIALQNPAMDDALIIRTENRLTKERERKVQVLGELTNIFFMGINQDLER